MTFLVWLAACAPAPEDTAEEPVPSIAEVLDCGAVGVAGGLAEGGDLQRFDLDPGEHPDAVCNDGSPAFFYFRPHEGEVDADRWVVQLQGGGACNTAESCFARWCSEGTNFGMQGMTADASPATGIRGQGILARRPDNPFGDFNQVFVRYCSSDEWAGSADTVATAPHPITGEEVTAELRFHGWDIVDAVVDVLRDGDVPTLPDLDDAEVVVLAGGSAGGAGTIRNADRVEAVLREHNPDLREFGALIDSILPPSLSHYDYTHTTLCTAYGLCDYATHQAATWDNDQAFRGQQTDASCLALHPADPGVCGDNGHVATHHVTAPFLVRMGQTDQNLSGDPVAAGFWYDGAPVELVDFALLVQQDLAALGDPAGNEEASSYTRAPAVFGPTCPGHEVLSDNAEVYEVTVDLGGDDLSMFQLLGRWHEGLDPAVAIAPTPADDHCP